MDFPGGSVVKSLPDNAQDPGDGGSVPGLRRSPGGRNDNPLQYSYLRKPTGSSPWGRTEADTPKWLNMHARAHAHTHTHTHTHAMSAIRDDHSLVYFPDRRKVWARWVWGRKRIFYEIEDWLLNQKKQHISI